MNRTRSRGQTTLSPCNYEYRLKEYAYFAQKSTRYKGKQEKIIDSIVPGYRKLRKQGAIVMNSCEIYEDEYVSTSSGNWFFSHPDWGTASLVGDCAGAVIMSAAEFSESEKTLAKARALVKAYATLNESPVLGGEIMSDFNKTVSMLKHPFKSATSLMSRMLYKRNKLLKSHTSDVMKANASAWLEYRYGWVPIIMDCKSILQIAKETTRKRDSGFRVARASDVNEKKLNNTFDHGIMGSWRARGTGTSTATYRSHVGIIYQISPCSIPEGVSRSLGLDARSIPATLWEIVPFSFVVDWFVNVGSFLQAIMPRSDIKILSSWQSSTYSYVRTISGGTIDRTIVEISPTPISGSLGGCKTMHRSLLREVNVSLPLAPFLTHVGLSGKQTADAAALSINRILSGLKKVKH